jgi:hypothetical protein
MTGSFQPALALAGAGFREDFAATIRLEGNGFEGSRFFFTERVRLTVLRAMRLPPPLRSRSSISF